MRLALRRSRTLLCAHVPQPQKAAAAADPKPTETAFLDEELVAHQGERIDPEDVLANLKPESASVNLVDQNDYLIPDPVPGTSLQQEFTRVRRSAKHVVLDVADERDKPPQQLDNWTPLPPPPINPWNNTQPRGPFLKHGDSCLNVVGTGLVGWEDTPQHAQRELPKTWRGLQHSSVVGHTLPQLKGFAIQDAYVKISLKNTGRGLFASKKVEKDDPILEVNSTVANIGHTTNVDRLNEMVRDVLLWAHHGDADVREYFHRWILNGQASSLVERWTKKDIDIVVDMIGGSHVLDELEIHPCHVARIAAIIELNSFLVESEVDQHERGSAYWPEASMINHSCCPNATYEIEPIDEVDEVTGETTRTHYRFKCVALREIQEGEEVLIAYCPPEWRYDDRQMVLHDRYRFWCRCDACAPVVEKSTKAVGYFSLLTFAIYIVLQCVIYKVRADFDKIDDLPEDEVHKHKHFFVS